MRLTLVRTSTACLNGKRGKPPRYVTQFWRAALVALVLGTLFTVGTTEGAVQEETEFPVSDLEAAPLGQPSGPVIAIDPGHGGREPGAVHRGVSGHVDLMEKEANLAIALRLESMLLERGYGVVLTRREDTEVNVPRTDRNGDGRIDTDDDLQARVDIANGAGAALLFSIHNNGSTSSGVRGTSTWYCVDHPRGEESRLLAAMLQGALVTQLRSAGYADMVDAGFHDDAPLRKPYGHLFLVGPPTPRVARASKMPGVVGESLYVTSDREAALLQNESFVDAIALAYVEAATSFLGGPGEAAAFRPVNFVTPSSV